MLHIHGRATRFLATTAAVLGLVGCDSPVEVPPYGVVEIRTATTGSSFDADGFVLRWDDRVSASVGIVDTVSRVLRPKNPAYSVEISGIAQNCVLAGDAARRIWVQPGETMVITFAVDCAYEPRDIAFERRDRETAIYAVGADGAYTVRVTATSARAPSWSPDGRNLAFAVTDDPWSREGLAITEGDGSVLRTLEVVGEGTIYDVSWAPDGQRLMYTASTWEDWCPEDETWIVDRIGDVRTFLGKGHGTGWSPDGLQVAVARSVSSDPCDSSDIHIVDVADRSDVSILAGHPASDTDAVWSPDGRRIAFSSARGGNYDIYLADVGGGDVIQLTDHPEWDGHPAWSPDGAQIAFASRRDGAGEIYLMNADGSGLVRLTDHPGEDGRPTWRPAVAGSGVQEQR